MQVCTKFNGKTFVDFHGITPEKVKINTEGPCEFHVSAGSANTWVVLNKNIFLPGTIMY